MSNHSFKFYIRDPSLGNHKCVISPLAKAEGGGFLAIFPDLPGCLADGETMEEAIMQAKDALKSYLLS